MKAIGFLPGAYPLSMLKFYLSGGDSMEIYQKEYIREQARMDARRDVQHNARKKTGSWQSELPP